MDDSIRVELRYDPSFVPGDVLKFSDGRGEGLVCGTKDAGVIEELLAKRPQRDYMVLFYTEAYWFGYGMFQELYLQKNATKTAHLNYGEMTSGGADVAEVLRENQTLRKRLASLMMIDSNRKEE